MSPTTNTPTSVSTSSPSSLSNNSNITSNADSKSVDTEKFSSLEWKFLSPMNMQREGGAAVAVGTEQVVVMGGYHISEKFLNSCASYLAKTKQWKSLPEMLHKRMGCGACCLSSSSGSKIVVAGGFQRGRTYLNTVEMLELSNSSPSSTTTMTWKQLSPMRNSRAGCAAVSFAPGSEFGGTLGTVIVCGGWKNADTAVDTVEQLDLATGQWTLLPSMLTSRAGCAAVVVDNTKIVVTGGYSNYGYCLSTAEVFDVSTQTWSSLPSMKERRDASAACVVGKCVVVVGGGESSTSPSKTCEVLNMDKVGDGWTAFPDLQSPRFGCAAAAMGNQILVLGGRGPEGQHLECVETITLPLLDKPKPPKPSAQRQRSRSDLGASGKSDRGLSAAVEEPPIGTPSSEEWKRMVDSTLKMANHMMAKDKARTNETYERSKTHEMDECARKVKEVEKKLKTLEIEKHRLERDKQKALRRRDEKLLEIEEQRRQSLAQIERHFRPLITRAANSSAPEYFTSDVGPSVSHSPSASDLALLIKDDDDEPPKPPEELICSITGVLMKDPVTAVDGHTYEREAIEIWYVRAL